MTKRSKSIIVRMKILTNSVYMKTIFFDSDLIALYGVIIALVLLGYTDKIRDFVSRIIHKNKLPRELKK